MKNPAKPAPKAVIPAASFFGSASILAAATARAPMPVISATAVGVNALKKFVMRVASAEPSIPFEPAIDAIPSPINIPAKKPAKPAPIAVMAAANCNLSTLNPANNPAARIIPPIIPADFSSNAPKKFWISFFMASPSTFAYSKTKAAPPIANINPAIPAPRAAIPFPKPTPSLPIPVPRAPNPVPSPPRSPAIKPPVFLSPC